MAKNNKNIEEKVDNEIKTVVEKVTETPDNIETTDVSNLTPSEIEENKEELDKLDEELDNLKNEAEKIQQEIKEEIKENLKELEKETPKEEKSEEPKEEKSEETPKEPKEVSDSELEDVLKAIAVCNWFNNLNIGKHLVNKFETTKEELKAFFDEYKSGNYLSSQEEYIVFRKLNDLFNN